MTTRHAPHTLARTGPATHAPSHTAAQLAAAVLLAALAGGCQNDQSRLDRENREIASFVRERSARQDALSRQLDRELAALAPGSPWPDPVVSRDPWPEGGPNAVRITTAHFDVLSTDADLPAAEALPLFCEIALLAYRRAFQIDEPLPPPSSRPQIYLAHDPQAWSQLVRAELGDQAADRVLAGNPATRPLDAVHTQIGFSVAGRAFFYAPQRMPLEAILRLAAHEGWHVYTQMTFAGRLPAWLDEALACTFEGFVLDETTPGAARFDERINPSRHAELARLGEVDLTLLLRNSTRAEASSVPVFEVSDYAQLWALGLFCRSELPLDGTRLLVQDALRGPVPMDLVELCEQYWTVPPESFSGAFEQYAEDLMAQPVIDARGRVVGG